MQPRATRLYPGVKDGSSAIPAYLSQSLTFPPTSLIPYKPIPLGLFMAYISRIPFHIHSFLSRKFSHINYKSKQSPSQGQCASFHTLTQLLMFQANKISHPNRNHLANVKTSTLTKISLTINCIRQLILA